MYDISIKNANIYLNINFLNKLYTRESFSCFYSKYKAKNYVINLNKLHKLISLYCCHYYIKIGRNNILGN